jgi:hypothetical protein
MIARLRPYTDVPSTIDDKIERQWGTTVLVRAPIELQQYGKGSILFLPPEATELADRDKVMWQLTIGAYVTRGGEIRWTTR